MQSEQRKTSTKDRRTKKKKGHLRRAKGVGGAILAPWTYIFYSLLPASLQESGSKSTYIGAGKRLQIYHHYNWCWRSDFPRT